MTIGYGGLGSSRAAIGLPNGCVMTLATIPTGDVIEKICRAYGWQPGAFIIYELDES